MRALAWIACCVALAAWGAQGEEAGDFASSATITPEGGDTLQRFVLPFEAYRDTRRDMADVRVFNGRGEPVPIALAGEAEPVKVAKTNVPLARFAVTKLDATPSGKGAEVSIRMSDGTLVSVRGRGGELPQNAVAVAYLVDASQATEPLAALVFDWLPGPGTEVVRVMIEASDDLQAWRSVGSATLVHVIQGRNVLEQPRAALSSSTKARYYRVTWSGDARGGVPAFVLQSVEGEYASAMQKAERAKIAVPGTAGEKPGEFVFDLGARLPVEAVRVVPGEPNSVAGLTILTRDSPQDKWRAVASGTFYRIERGGAQLESNPVEVSSGLPARYWMVRADPSSGGLGSTPPTLEVQWRSRQVIFAARGPAPFRLAFGAAEAKPAWVSAATLIPDYKRGEELKLPEARVGAVEGAPPAAPSALPAFVAEVGGPRKLALWSILLLGVLVLGAMAWRLSSQMGSESRVGVEGQGRGSESGARVD
jgi:hypothetical protein